MKPIKGIYSKFYVMKNGEYLPCACLTSSPINESVDMIGTTTRENEGWKTSEPTNHGYTIELSGLMVMDDSDSDNNVVSFRQLRAMHRNNELIEWKKETLDGYYIDSGRSYITSISDSDEADGFITFTASLTGYGKPNNETNNRIYILGNVPKTQIYTHPDEITVIQTKDI
jgi:predicted secreted protein